MKWLLILILVSCSSPKKEETSKQIEIQDKWYHCTNDSECTIIRENECGHYIAINRLYRDEVLNFLDKKGLPFECKKKWRVRPEALCDLVTNTCKMDDGDQII